MNHLRRSLAVLLLALSIFLLVSPAIIADFDANLPACCRRNGQHHCSMSMNASTDAAGSTTGASFAARAGCPMYPRAVFSLGGFAPAAILAAVSAKVGDVRRAVGNPQSPASLSALDAPAHPKRGPPQFASLD